MTPSTLAGLDDLIYSVHLEVDAMRKKKGLKPFNWKARRVMTDEEILAVPQDVLDDMRRDMEAHSGVTEDKVFPTRFCNCKPGCTGTISEARWQSGVRNAHGHKPAEDKPSRPASVPVSNTVGPALGGGQIRMFSAKDALHKAKQEVSACDNLINMHDRQAQDLCAKAEDSLRMKALEEARREKLQALVTALEALQ